MATPNLTNTDRHTDDPPESTPADRETAGPTRAWRALVGPVVSLGLLVAIAARMDLSAIGASLGSASVAAWLGATLLFLDWDRCLRRSSENLHSR